MILESSHYIIYADTSLLVFFGAEGGALSGRLERSEGGEGSIVKPFFKMWGYRKWDFFYQQKNI